MTDGSNGILRRRVLGLGATAAVALGIGKAGADTPPVPALSKSAVGYQDVPKGGQVCAQCVYFIFYPTGASATPQSRCKLVAGSINPAGWCQVWAPKA